jgi:Cu/Ag efflux protein CusF
MQKLIAIALVGLAGVLGPMFNVQAADKDAPAEKKEAHPPFNGKVTAVDAAAKTITVGKRTFHVVEASKIQAAGKSATLADAKMGDQVGGQYRTTTDGKLEILSLRIGPKPDEKK